MTLKSGSSISGTITMRVTQAGVLVASGHGRLTRGKATLTMSLRRRMTPGRYTVAMVVTLTSTMVLRLGGLG
jgi:hypothetical protein